MPRFSALLSRLQDIQCLRSLDLTTPTHPRELSQSQNSVPKENTVPISELTRFRYDGSPTFLNNLMCGLSAPSLQDVKFKLRTQISLLYLPRVIDDVREEFRSVGVHFIPIIFTSYRRPTRGKSTTSSRRLSSSVSSWIVPRIQSTQ